MAKALLCILSFLAFSLLCESKHVLTLKDKNFTEFVESHDMVLVTFYSKKCPHCQAFEPVFESAAFESAMLGRPYRFARVEVDEEYVTSDQQKIESLPTIRLFVKGVAIQPDYERDTVAILRYLDQYTKDLYHSLGLNQVQEILSRAQPQDPTNPRIFLVTDNPKEVDIFRQVASEFLDLTFFNIPTKAGTETFPGIEFPAVIIFKDFDEKRAMYRGVMTKEKIKEFVEDGRYPKVREFDHETVGKVFKSGGMKAITMFYSKERTQDLDKLMEEFGKVAREKRDKEWYFIAAEPHVGMGEKVAKIVGVEEGDTPILVIIERKSHEMEAYPYHGPFTAASISQFIEDWKSGKVPQMAKSERFPPVQDASSPVRKIVGKTFKKEVLEFAGNVLIIFCVPSSEKCRKFVPVLPGLAEKLKGNVKVGIIDPVKNAVEDLSGADFAKLPILKLYLKNDKKHPKVYEDGVFTEESIVEFVKKSVEEKIERADL